jgi:hypothetical protein
MELISKRSGLRALLTLTAIVLAVLGGGLLLVPNLMAAFYGVPVTVDGTNAARTAGAAIFALGMLAWFSKRKEVGPTRAVSIPVLFVWFVLKSVVACLAVFNRVFDRSVGVTVLFFDVLLAAAYGYYLLSLFNPPPKCDRESPSTHQETYERSA